MAKNILKLPEITGAEEQTFLFHMDTLKNEKIFMEDVKNAYGNNLPTELEEKTTQEKSKDQETKLLLDAPSEKPVNKTTKGFVTKKRKMISDLTIYPKQLKKIKSTNGTAYDEIKPLLKVHPRDRTDLETKKIRKVAKLAKKLDSREKNGNVEKRFNVDLKISYYDPLKTSFKVYEKRQTNEVMPNIRKVA